MSAIISASVLWHLDTMRINEMKHKIKDLAKENSFYLYKKIDQMMALSYPISSTILEDGQTHDFESIAKKLILHYPMISEIALAPNGIIKNVVPLSGNEKAIGFNLFTDPQQRSEALIARESGKLTLAGPLNLVQGKEGIVGRLPVFKGEDKKFWGFVIIVIRFPDILHTNALNDLTKNGYQYTITRIHPQTKQLQMIAASSNKKMDHPVETIIKLPNAQWKLHIAPTEGWHDHWLLAIGTTIGTLISLLLGYVAKQFTELRHHRYLLEKRVYERTSEISETKNQLHTLLDTIPELIWL
ncbi:MAG: CHASE domain-containing protein [Sulfuricurvum sp.]|uniref:CHASE domain-containing protein n=1 Tax=Sulfuricurvum sp. TaxID=2025608 RepID=UPI002732659B|nr:CHASE domain-containing protein [Sulfuricurvum sp.]MDP3291043.1 CHASE domain-containing protein [Sulfuricurvum sp.]